MIRLDHVSATFPGLLFALLVAAAIPAGAQGFRATGGAVPIQVSADNGIEWDQDTRAVTARGNAVAIRGELTVRSNVLRAYYRDASTSGTEIWRLDAQGSVVIETPREQATGNLGVYEVDHAVFVLSGPAVSYRTQDTLITADRQLEYWEGKQLAVARGRAAATRDGNTVRADVLAAYFRRDGTGKTELYRLEGFDNVRIDTGKDTATARRAVYDVVTGIAVLTGSVRIARDNTRLNGCRAEVNMNTGLSRLESCAPGGGTQRVRGLVVPSGVKKQ